MKSRVQPAVVGLAILILLAIRPPGATSTGDPGRGIPDDSIGLVAEDIRAIPIPDAVHDNRSEPGEHPPTSPWNEDAPPAIPHGTADFLPIRPSENLCLDCHAVEEKIEGEPTPIPESHFRDLRNAPDTVRSEVAGSRYVCTSCHVDQTDAAPLPIRGRQAPPGAGSDR